MISLYILIGIVVFFALALSISNKIHRKKGTPENEARPPLIKLEFGNEDGGCCGNHDICEKDSLIAAFQEEAEYFDDEELDRFKLRESGSYTDKEADEFRDVFYTIIDEEKPRWIRSLQLREISVPNQMKDEVVMIVSELRETKMQTA